MSKIKTIERAATEVAQAAKIEPPASTEATCKYCGKVKANAKNLSMLRYGKCRPHSLLTSYRMNPCNFCEFYLQNDCGDNPLECKNEIPWPFTGSVKDFLLSKDKRCYGSEWEYIEKKWYGWRYWAANGNTALIIRGRVFRYKYHGSLLKFKEEWLKNNPQ